MTSSWPRCGNWGEMTISSNLIFFFLSDQSMESHLRVSSSFVLNTLTFFHSTEPLLGFFNPKQPSNYNITHHPLFLIPSLHTVRVPTQHTGFTRQLFYLFHCEEVCHWLEKCSHHHVFLWQTSLFLIVLVVLLSLHNPSESLSLKDLLSVHLSWWFCNIPFLFLLLVVFFRPKRSTTIWCPASLRTS